MNDMKETVAEIRRRGEARIQVRKRLRGRLTALCVPLVLSVPLVLCVAALLLKPDRSVPTSLRIPDVTVCSAQMKDDPVSVQYNTQTSSTVILKVRGGGISFDYSDPETVQAMQDMFTNSETWSQGTAYTADEYNEQTSLRSPEEMYEIRFLFVTPGKSREYILFPGYFLDLQENKKYLFSSAQAQVIESILCLELP